MLAWAASCILRSFQINWVPAALSCVCEPWVRVVAMWRPLRVLAILFSGRIITSFSSQINRSWSWVYESIFWRRRCLSNFDLFSLHFEIICNLLEQDVFWSWMRAQINEFGRVCFRTILFDLCHLSLQQNFVTKIAIKGWFASVWVCFFADRLFDWLKMHWLRFLFCLVLRPDRDPAASVFLQNPIPLIDSLAKLSIESFNRSLQVVCSLDLSFVQSRLLKCFWCRIIALLSFILQH